MKSFLHKITALFLIAFLSLSCTDDVLGEYSRQRAFFRFDQVNSVPQLRSALNDPGMFCTITFPPSVYLFTDANGRSTQVNRTSNEHYGRPEFIAGFLVGTPALPNLSGNFYQVAYDLVCPNCYSETTIRRSLSFMDPTTMKCGKCGREYDLNNSGVVRNEQKGRPLYRYRMSFSPLVGGVLKIENH